MQVIVSHQTTIQAKVHKSLFQARLFQSKARFICQSYSSILTLPTAYILQVFVIVDAMTLN